MPLVTVDQNSSTKQMYWFNPKQSSFLFHAPNLFRFNLGYTDFNSWKLKNTSHLYSAQTGDLSNSD